VEHGLIRERRVSVEPPATLGPTVGEVSTASAAEAAVGHHNLAERAGHRWRAGHAARASRAARRTFSWPFYVAHKPLTAFRSRARSQTSGVPRPVTMS
jgi:hypothetical protein